MNYINKILDYLHKRKDPISYARKLGVVIGKDCRLIDDVKFGAEPYLVTLGNHVSVTSSSFITHDGGIWIFRNKHPKIDVIKPIKVGNNVFIGAGCTILPGVSIGNNVVVGAKSLVSKSLESNFVYAGVPAKKIKSIDEYYKSVYPDFINTKGLSFDQKKKYLTDNLINK